MGLIKTAMLAGAGMYAVNKIAKTAEHRREQPSTSGNAYAYRDQQPQYFDGPDPRGEYYSAPQGQMNGQSRSQSQSKSRGMDFDDRRSSQDGTQPLYLENNPYPPLPHGYARPEYTYTAAAGDRAAPAQPPAYSGRRSPAGFVEAYEGSEADVSNQAQRGGGGGSAALLDTLAQHLMGGDQKGRGKEMGKDFVNMFK